MPVHSRSAFAHARVFVGAVFSVTSSVPGWSYGENEARPLVSGIVGSNEESDKLMVDDYVDVPEHDGEESQVPTWFAVVNIGGKQFKVSLSHPE